jgi:hypothetical protein
MPAWIGPTLKVVLNPKNHVRRNISISITDALTRFRKHTPADHLHRSYSDPGPSRHADAAVQWQRSPAADIMGSRGIGITGLATRLISPRSREKQYLPELFPDHKTPELPFHRHPTKAHRINAQR